MHAIVQVYTCFNILLHIAPIRYCALARTLIQSSGKALLSMVDRQKTAGKRGELCRQDSDITACGFATLFSYHSYSGWIKPRNLTQEVI